jgi:hypothetical protein
MEGKFTNRQGFDDRIGIQEDATNKPLFFRYQKDTVFLTVRFWDAGRTYAPDGGRLLRGHDSAKSPASTANLPDSPLCKQPRFRPITAV